VRRVPDDPREFGSAVPESSAPRTTGPSFPSVKPSPVDLSLTVRAPQQVQLGRPALFEAVVRNNGAAAVKDARVMVAFDEGLRFPGKEARSFDQQLGELPPGKSQTVALSLRGESLGTRCTRFRLALDGRETVWKSVCVQVVPRQYSLTIAAAPLRSVGSRTEFTVSLANVATEELRGAVVAVEFDPRQLKPLTGSHGAKVENGRITWAVNRLRPGVGVNVQGEMACVAVAKAVCLTATVTVQNGPADRETACWQVIEQGRPFDMRIADTRDLIRVGDTTEVVISVQNRSGKRATLPQLTTQIPESFRVVSTSVWEGTQSLAGRAAVDKGTVTFRPVAMVERDAALTYRIRVEAVKPGRTAFTAKIPLEGTTSLELSEPVMVVR
jgi:uncharacterized repeat protein (TIGR01451 family)